MSAGNLKERKQSEALFSHANKEQNNSANQNDHDNKPRPDLIIEQYAQYYQMVRHHTSLSWQIPSFTIACFIVFFGLDSSKIENWRRYPILPAACFFVICLFLVVMLVHHKRNGLYASQFDKALIELEQKWGVEKDVHHKHSQDSMTSSKCLTYFLALLIAVSFFVSMYFLYQVLS